ncbi:rhoGAP domain-containing protein [Reticulomyxa filosa]|uniref:RhoGAP domain-containing protein n=1 Tax=Reticulomyxa filosa TaxID=46433 RepID=X6NJI4_RETFI|nr:rhoGAP domain-containing protein [Reticulomyxa filosa]|eukprot:ETO26156.1 rhoGAP domain-containing protein [Reticulomyxa filosa]
MAVTKEMDANATIPYIVPLLCEKVKEFNGFHTEGIFRKSASSADLRKLRNKLRMKNFTFEEQNVHIFANCLKTWLRSLEDPLIPELYYDFCVEMAKQGKLDKGQFEVFFSQLPAVNRETLKYLVHFLRELIQPQYVKTTLMTLDNLAIVFGPTLLRSEILDPNTALMNTHSEKKFICFIFFLFYYLLVLSYKTITHFLPKVINTKKKRARTLFYEITERKIKTRQKCFDQKKLCDGIAGSQT